MKLLMDSNQSLLNQARATDLSTLAGANQLIMPQGDSEYVSTDDRELAAYYDAIKRSHVEETYDEGFEEDMEILRGVM
jgi:hypothetical protein